MSCQFFIKINVTYFLFYLILLYFCVCQVREDILPEEVFPRVIGEEEEAYHREEDRRDEAFRRELHPPKDRDLGPRKNLMGLGNHRIAIEGHE